MVPPPQWLAFLLQRGTDIAVYSAINQAPEPRGFPAQWLPPGWTGVEDSTACSEEAKAVAERQELADIEEAHRCAVREGKLQYTDPVTGYSVFSQLASSRRGYCCGSGCRHCVYNHENVKPERKAKIRRPITCEVDVA